MKYSVVFSLLILVGLLLTGCQAGYYSHLGAGHWALMRQRQPVEVVLAQDNLSDAIRHKLQLSQSVRTFAAQHLQLPVGDAYSSYAPLDRDWATWNLFAAPALSLTAKQWCYPVVGCASYRGYFDQQRAEHDAQKLRAAGLEVYASGAIAYSTLGWFDDPLTTPMLAGSDGGFAELLFHELAHRRFYLKGDTRFNESLASAVAREGLRQWGAQDPAAPAGLAGDMEQRAVARRWLLDTLADARASLRTLYAMPVGNNEKYIKRDRIRQSLRDQFQQAVLEIPVLAGYRQWFAGPLNNAQLNTVADYETWVPAFDVVLYRCRSDWACFWKQVEQIAAMAAEPRQAYLEALTTQQADEYVND